MDAFAAILVDVACVFFALFRLAALLTKTINRLRSKVCKVQAVRQRQLQAHNVTVEESDSGGYQVVE